MTAAAADGLSAGQQAELRAHASCCAACARELEAARALATAIKGTIETMVSGEPRPEFAARLRARLSAEQEPSRWSRVPRFAVGAGLAAAALLAALLIRAPMREPARPASAAGGQQTIGPGPAVSAPFARAERLPEASDSRAKVRAARAGRSTALPFEVLVPPNQLAAALELNDAVNAGRVDGERLVELAQQPASPLKWESLEIEPLDHASEGAVTPASGPGLALPF